MSGGRRRPSGPKGGGGRRPDRGGRGDADRGGRGEADRGGRGEADRGGRGEADRGGRGEADRGGRGEANRRTTRRRPKLPDQLEGRNLVLASLTRGGRVREVWIDDAARPDPKLDALREAAERRGAGVHRVPRADLDAVSETQVHNGVIGFAEPLPHHTLAELLDRCTEEGREPFLVLLNEVQYEQNLGAILRSSAYAGVDAVVVPTRRGASVTPVVQRVAMGGAEEVPVVRQGMMATLATLRRAGVRIVGAEADGEQLYTETPFDGPLALVLGGEDRGLGPKVRERCDAVVRIPASRSGVVSSLNVSVAAGLLLFERLRARGG